MVRNERTSPPARTTQQCCYERKAGERDCKRAGWTIRTREREGERDGEEEGKILKMYINCERLRYRVGHAARNCPAVRTENRHEFPLIDGLTKFSLWPCRRIGQESSGSTLSRQVRSCAGKRTLGAPILAPDGRCHHGCIAPRICVSVPM